MAKKLKNEPALVKEALQMGMKYGVDRGVVEFEATDSANDKITYVYRLLVHDNLVHPLAKGQESLPNMKHKLAHWAAKQLPADHPLKK